MSDRSGLHAGSSVEDSDVVRVGLNGFGRIGRSVFRAVLEDPRIALVGINDVMDRDEMAYLARYDTVMGTLENVYLEDDALVVDDTQVPLFNIQNPDELPWDELDVDVAFESTGIFRTRDAASNHLDAGADTVVISAPPKGDKPVPQFVYGVNHEEYDGESIVSNASCTTNSITPVAKVLDDEFGIDAGILTTVHAYTGSQNLVDGPNSKPRRRRAAAENIIPTSTGAAQATTSILPELEGKLDGMAMRVPVPNGSITDFTVDLQGDPSVAAINDTFREAADGELAGVLGYTDEEIVSSDVIGAPFSSQVDLSATRTIADGAMAKVLTWYDNEFGFANRMLDLGSYVTNY
ncbi:MAG: type I glyceraldehyde-3-phosphate dehydrogenase [Halodesulfurarchaeum sp.]